MKQGYGTRTAPLCARVSTISCIFSHLLISGSNRRPTQDGKNCDDNDSKLSAEMRMDCSCKTQKQNRNYIIEINPHNLVKTKIVKATKQMNLDQP